MEIMEMEVEADAPKTESQEEKLGKCEVCDLRVAKYTCPRCEVKTCSLPCVNIHKRELECSGIRDKTFFKKMSRMGNLDLLSDYRLLEEVSRSVDKYRKDPLKYTSWVRKTLPVGMFRIKVAASQRGIRLHYLPAHFSRHKENTTFLIYKSNRLEWRVEWIFPQADNLRLVSERVLETLTLAQALSPHLNPDLCEDNVVREKLQFHYSAGVGNVIYLIRVGEMEKKRYHILDGSLSLYTNLQKKSIIEFPTIYVILKDHQYYYTIYDSDRECTNGEESESGSSDCEDEEEELGEEEGEEEVAIVTPQRKPLKNLLLTNEDSTSSSSDSDA